MVITGPEGEITPIDITSLGNDEYEVTCIAQTRRGSYTACIGPEVTDLAGNVLSGAYDFGFYAFDADTIFTATTTVTKGDATYDGQDILIDGAHVTIDGSHSFNSVHLVDGALLTHSANTTTETHKLDVTVTSDVIIDSACAIDVCYKGYLADRTTGNTTEGGATGKATPSL